MLKRWREHLYVAAIGRETAMNRIGIYGAHAAQSIQAELSAYERGSFQYRILERSLTEVRRLLAEYPDLFTCREERK